MEPREMKVRDIMQYQVVTVEPEMSVRQAAHLLYEKEITGAPVVDEEGKVVGVLSGTDVVRLASEGRPLGRTLVREIMTPATISVRPDASVAELARFLLQGKIHRALVFEGQELRGLVTSLDVLEVVAEELEERGSGA